LRLVPQTIASARHHVVERGDLDEGAIWQIGRLVEHKAPILDASFQ